MGIFAKISGLNKLVGYYPTKGCPDGKKLTKQTIQIGAIRYRSCVTIIVNEQGLYMKISVLFSSNELFVPWTDIKNPAQTSLYGQKAFKLSLVEAENSKLTVYKELFNLIERHL